MEEFRLPPVREALDKDDVCWQASGDDGEGSRCALEALQRLVHARISLKGKAAAAAVEAEAIQNLTRCGEGCGRLVEGHHAENVILLAAKWLARAELGREPLQLAHDPHADGWAAAQLRWEASGHRLPTLLEIPEIELRDVHGHERASVVAPIVGVSLLLVLLFILVGCRSVMKLVAPDEASRVRSENSLPSLPPNRGYGLPRPQAEEFNPTSELAELPGQRTPIMDGEGLTVSRTPSTRTPSEPDTCGTKTEDANTIPVPFFSLFRFATRKDFTAYVGALILALVHGCTVPTAFYMMDQLYKAIYLPNDDGTIPPTFGPHAHRDAEVWIVARRYLVLACVVLVCRSLSIMLVVWTADRQALQLRRAFFSQILFQGPSWHDLVNSSEMATQLTQDTFYFREGIGEKIVDVVRSSSVTCSAICLGVYKDWKLTLLMVLAMPVAVLSIMTGISILREFSDVQQRLYSKAGGISESALVLLRTVTAFNGQLFEMKRYGEQLHLAETKGTRMGLISGFCNGVNTAVMAFTLSLGMYAGSIWVLDGYEQQCWESSPPFGTCRTGGTMLASMYTITWGFSAGLGTLGVSLDAITFARSAAQRIFAVLDQPLVIQSGNKILDTVKGIVTYDAVRFSYPGRQAATALYGVSLQIEAGTTAAFVGPSGSGKSTMVSLLLRFYEPQGGSVLLDGHSIRTLDLKWLRSKISLVEQEPVLFGTSIFGNIANGKEDVQPTDVEQAAMSANAHSFILGFPEGYLTLVGERGAQLSGGQKQRIAIARALIRKPAVLLLDEATSALDTESEQIVQAALDKLMEAKARTTMVIAHRLSTIQNADKIFVMQDGHLAEQGSHVELLTQEGSLYGQLVQLSQGKKATATGLAQNVPDTIAGESEPVAEKLVVELAPAIEPVCLPAPQGGAEALLTPQKSAEVAEHCSQPVRRTALAATKAEIARERQDEQRVAEESISVMPFLWRLSRPDWHLYVAGVSLTLVSASITPMYCIRFAQSINMFNLPPVVWDPVTSSWIPDYDESRIAKNVSALCLMMQVMGIIGIGSSIGSFWNFNAAGERLVRRLRADLFKSLIRQEIGWHDQTAAGILVGHLAQDIPHTRMLVGSGLAGFCQATLQVIVGLSISLLLSWRFTLSIFFALPVIAVGPIAMEMSLRQLKTNISGGLVVETISSIKTVSAFSLEHKILDRYTTILQEQMEKEVVHRVGAGFGTGLATGGIFLMLSITVWSANIWINRALMPPDRAAMVLFTLFSCVTALSQASSWLSESGLSRQSARRVLAIISRASKIDALGERGKRPTQATGRIDFQEVDFHYPCRPDMPVFCKFSLTIQPNTSVALVGPSGSGKSTTVALLQRFYDPQFGSVRFDGHDLRDLHIGWLRSQMGLVQQEPVLFSGSIMDNIKYSAESTSYNAVVEAAKMANAHDFIMGMPDQYLTEVGARGGQLSGGQKQRIAIARAVVRKPTVLLLDEATSSLDAASERCVQEALDSLLHTKKRTTLIIAHRLSTIKSADQICVMHCGEVVETGTHEELMGKPEGMYKRLVGRQQDIMTQERAIQLAKKA